MEKVARLCWNTNEWRRPSGRKGKSKSSDSYEKGMGFGHKEWLLDDSKIINGYHYGYHINQIYAENEQDPERTHKKFLLVRQEGNRRESRGRFS